MLPGGGGEFLVPKELATFDPVGVQKVDAVMRDLQNVPEAIDAQCPEVRTPGAVHVSSELIRCVSCSQNWDLNFCFF